MKVARLTTLVLVAALAVAAAALGSGGAKTIRVALKPNGHEVPANNAEYIAASSDGRFWAFEATGRLTPKDDDNTHDVYVYDRKTGKNKLVSVNSKGRNNNADCAAADISPNGRYVSFSCDDPLTKNDTNGLPDVYRHDRKTGKTILVSVRSDGSQVTGIDDASVVSGVAGNGVVAWESHGAFVSGDTNDAWDTFVRDPRAHTTVRASVDSQGNQLPDGINNLGPTKASKVPISGNGNVVAFQSDDVATTDSDYGFAVDSDVFARNLAKGTTTRVSLKKDGTEADPNHNASSDSPSISADGRYVAFRAADNAPFSAKDDDNGADVYVKDLKTGKLTFASVKPSGNAAANADAQFPEISDNGRYVAWDGFAEFGPSPTPGRDVYMRDLKAGKTKLVSGAFKGLHADDNQIADPSSTGWVGFESMGKLTPQPDDGMDWDVFIRGPLG